MQDIIGQTILDRYRVDTFVGRGGMAEVYKVWDRQRLTHLAMKVLRDDLALDVVFLDRFHREARTLEKLQHPNIVRFYGLEQDRRLAFMLMEFVEGETLKHEIFDCQDRGMPAERMMAIMRPVCSALGFAHNQGMVHCDMKPGNVMVHQNGTVLVADFGIARMTDAATATMVGMGTPAYMAPEQVRGHDPTPQTDIYALGVVLYEMLTGGRRPFTGEQATTTGSTSEKVRWEQLNLQAPSPRSYNPDISPAVEAVVLRCLSKDPAYRFGITVDLLNALERAMGGAEPAVPPRAARAKPDSQAEESVVNDAQPELAEAQLVRAAEAAPVLQVEEPVVDDVRPEPEPVEPDARPRAAQARPASRVEAPVADDAQFKPKRARIRPAPDVQPVRRRGVPVWVWVVGAVVGLAVILGAVALGGKGRASVVPTETAAATVVEATSTDIPTLEPTATNTPTLEPTATLDPMVLCRGAGIADHTCTGVVRNADWTPYIEEIKGVEMALVPAGCFQMGSEGDYNDERPVHEVCFEEPFWIDATEVTNGQFAAFDGQAEDSSYRTAAESPREHITWSEADAFCQKRGARLPTEAEWEYAARGPDGLVYPWGDTWDGTLTVWSTSQAANVGSKPGGVSWVGAYDLTGNVWEWVSDWYLATYYGTLSDGVVNPQGPDSGTYRVLRGGSWYYRSYTQDIRVAYRERDNPSFGSLDYGFRCALSY